MIESKRLAHPKMSVSKAAQLANISEGRWRQLAKGFQQATPDTRVAAKAPAETLARMANAVGMTADELKDAGRADAAKALEDMRSAPLTSHSEPAPPEPSAPTELFVRARSIWPVGRMVFSALDELTDLPAETKAELASAFAQVSINLAEALLDAAETNLEAMAAYGAATIACRKFVELHDRYNPKDKMASPSFYRALGQMQDGLQLEEKEDELDDDATQGTSDESRQAQKTSVDGPQEGSVDTGFLGGLRETPVVDAGENDDQGDDLRRGQI